MGACPVHDLAYSPWTEDWSDDDYESTCHWCGHPCPDGTTGSGGCSAECGEALAAEPELHRLLTHEGSFMRSTTEHIPKS